MIDSNIPNIEYGHSNKKKMFTNWISEKYYYSYCVSFIANVSCHREKSNFETPHVFCESSCIYLADQFLS